MAQEAAPAFIEFNWLVTLDTPSANRHDSSETIRRILVESDQSNDFFDGLFSKRTLLHGVLIILCGLLIIIIATFSYETAQARLQKRLRITERTAVPASAPAVPRREPLPDQRMAHETLTRPPTRFNPLERADLLMAVADFEEAENVLRKALDETPDDPELIIKLFEVHYATANKAAFLREARLFHEKVSDNDPYWTRTTAMGRKLCPDADLFSVTSTIDVPIIPAIPRLFPDDGAHSGGRPALDKTAPPPTQLPSHGREDMNPKVSWQVRDSITLSRCLKGLRDFLEDYQRKPAEAPAYFSACGIGKILTWLQEKPSQHQVLFESEQTLCPSLQGHWRDYWWQIFRSVLLLETYWPDEQDAQLYEELRYSRDVIRHILAKYGIRVHSLGLLDQATLNTEVQDGFSSSLEAELRNNAHFYETVKPRADKGRTYCDVGAWGYDVDGNVKKSTVIVIGPGEMW